VLLAPVPGPPTLGFDLPAGPYGAGSRGLRWDLAAVTSLRAPVDGTVTFVGRVVDATWVSIRPAGDATTVVTIGDVVDPAVTRGARVARGAVVGTSGTSVHVGVRVDGVYVDPAPLLLDRPAAVRLVPDGRFGDGGGCRSPPTAVPTGVVSPVEAATD
jgi:murein DD-endopeptidase MepM/ murein hydrolase activator NlpD